MGSKHILFVEFRQFLLKDLMFLLVRLRMRIKALNHTVDDQKKRITEYMAKESVTMLNGGEYLTFL